MKKLYFLTVALVAGNVLAGTLCFKPSKDDTDWMEVGDNKAVTVVVDTALTNTVTTSYLPAYVGQMLVGKTSTTGAVWVATSVSTNGWTSL